GGNSAGQAAIFLSGIARHVHLLVRRPGLSDTMSRYLIDRIEKSPSITLRTNTEIMALEGNGQLDRVTWRNTQSGANETHAIRHIFSMTGADPNTDWLQDCVLLDDQCFIKTGFELSSGELETAKWPLRRH